jgi:putative chitinase
MITGIQLKNICPNLAIERANTLAELIKEICPKYKIDTSDRLHEFVGQIAHESGEFSIRTENMDYTTPSRIVTIWPSRFNLTGTDRKLNANEFVRNEQKLANSVYANRMGNGDAKSNDGFRFRGGGFCQITGRDSYSKYAKFINKTVEETSDLVRGTDKYALDSACWLFAVEKQLLDEADADDFLTITRRINGGVIGLTERVKYYNRAKKYIL